MQKKLLAAIALVSCMLLASVALVVFATSSHSHTFDTEWKYDETEHWHEATCKHTSEVSNKTKHNFSTGMITTAPTCDADGVKVLKCECGATQTEPVVTMGHSYTWKTQVEGNCVSAEVLEGTCSGCGATTSKESVVTDRHTWGEWYVAKASTCTAVGIEERVCSHDKTHKETRELALGQHQYVGYQITKAPTTTTEGEMKAKCKNPECGQYVTLKILKTPEMALNGVKLSWKSVNSAKGYCLYDNGKLVADLGKVLTCMVSTEAGTHNYMVEAYTENTKYHSTSLKSKAVEVKVAFGENLQIPKGTDFEKFATQESVEIVKKWMNDYYNGSAGKVTVIHDNNNTYVKLLPVADAGAAILTKSCNTAVLKAGTYKLSFDVKLGSQADGTLSFGIWDGVAWAPAWPKAAIDTTKANADGWTTVTYEFAIAADKTGTYANLDLAYTCGKAGENNYVLVDNIQLINVASNTNADTGKNGNLESFFTPLSDLLKTSGWKSDGTGDVIYVSENALENEIVAEANGNKCFKFYTSSGASTSVNFAGNTAFSKAGIYKMSVKVKLGEKAADVDNIGFRFYAQNSLDTGDIMFEGLDKLNSSEWVTLECYFIVPETVTTSYINMNFWVFTHNDEIKSVDNYVLMDDVSVYPVTINGCDHDYDVYKLTTAPTTAAEGEMTAKCKNTECDEVLTLKVLMTPQLTKNGTQLTWNAVPNATGYRLYDNNTLVADLVDILSYEIPVQEAIHNYTIEAYTDHIDYHSNGFKSDSVEATVSAGDNLQASKGTDFEGFGEPEAVEVVQAWSNGYYNGSAGSVQIISDAGNTCAKLTPVTNNGYATITRAANVAVLKAGTYRISMDVKLGSAVDGTLSFGIWSGSQPWVPGYRTPIAMTNANADGWTTVTYEYTLSADKAGKYANLDIGYMGVTAGEGNYVLIDNIKVIKTSTNTNVDVNPYADFEGLLASPSDLLKTSGWKADASGNNVIFVSDGVLENEIVVEDNGNKCFKFYTSDKSNSSINFAGSTAFATAGTYKMSVKVKLGSGAANVDNIGFRFYAQSDLNTGDISFSGLEQLSSEEWVTLEAYFTVPETVTTTYINMNFWVFTHNDEINRVDNYVLMDDIEVSAVTLSE